MDVMILYTNSSDQNITSYGPMDIITARLNQYTADQGVESELVLTLPQNIVALNGTVLECRSEDLTSQNEALIINTAGFGLLFCLMKLTYCFCLTIVPLAPSGFSINMEVFTFSNLTLTFEWDGPQGSGPQAIVDYYTIAITPEPLSSLNITRVPNSPQAFNATLSYNVNYEVAITAGNCAGESNSFVFSNQLLYGKSL